MLFSNPWRARTVKSNAVLAPEKTYFKQKKIIMHFKF